MSKLLTKITEALELKEDSDDIITVPIKNGTKFDSIRGRLKDGTAYYRKTNAVSGKQIVVDIEINGYRGGHGWGLWSAYNLVFEDRAAAVAVCKAMANEMARCFDRIENLWAKDTSLIGQLK